MLPSLPTKLQINILQRHGARFPTLGAALDMASSASKLQGRKTYAKELAFLFDWEYNLGFDDLLPRGAHE